MWNDYIRQISQRAEDDPEFRHQLNTTPRAALEVYNLPEEVLHQIILPNFSWVIERRLAGMARPTTEDAMDILQDLGVTALITLTEQALTANLLSRYTLQTYHWPIIDYTAPSLEQADQIATCIQDLLSNRQTVVVHCAGGLGRTGTILACYLVAEGISAAEAITTIRTLRPGSIETEAQEELIHLYAQLPRT